VIVTSATVGPLQENAWLVVDADAREAVLIDPGDEPDRLAALVEASGARLTAIWLTHAHVDHVGAVAALVERYDVPVALHPADRLLYDRAPEIGRMYGMTIPSLPAPSLELAEGQTVRVGTQAFTVWHVPGHAPGHVLFIGETVAFVGDLVFAGSIGRTDLPLSDPAAMRRSLARAATLPASLTLHPGHGPSTDMARELSVNPFLSGLARPIGS
jgi:glyoxylase-like metal-dependent hydrolase (beta-lactamase superfamily II)